MNLTAEPALHQGKYILDTQLGKGVFSLTYRATHTESGQPVVIKTLGESLRQHPNFDQFKQKFLNRAKALRQCQHPHLVQVLDSFEDAGCPYLVMNYIPGQTLAELIPAEGLPEAKAIEYIRQIADALSVLHQGGLLHRDIKPENIIRRQDTDSLVLCDIGITCELTLGVMQTHASLLSAGYSPLEQYAVTEKRTRATDIYALVATLYCLLTGSPPLPAPVRQALQSKGDDCLFSPEILHKDQLKISPEIQQALQNGLELVANKRPQSPKAWLSQLPSLEKIPTPEDCGEAGEIRGQGDKETRGQGDKEIRGQGDKETRGQGELALHHSFTPSCVPKPYTPTRKHSAKEFLKDRKGSKVKTAKAKARLPLQALLMTGAIAASAGIGFGFAVRINRPHEPGATILHTQQTFPPRSNWPVSQPRLQF